MANLIHNILIFINLVILTKNLDLLCNFWKIESPGGGGGECAKVDNKRTARFDWTIGMTRFRAIHFTSLTPVLSPVRPSATLQHDWTAVLAKDDFGKVP